MKEFTVLMICLLLRETICGEEFDSNELNETLSSFYTAAVVEFNAPGVHLSDPVEIVDANLAEYLSLIKEASEQGVDIIVFSEASLNYNGIKSIESLREVAVEIQVEVPTTSDCDFLNDVILRELSFAASNASIYVLANVVEKEKADDDNFIMFNTNLVFDRNGCIVSRYRKYNLFVEPFMNITSSPELATFETDFGVTFGHFICFDILFKSPAIDLIEQNVTHFLYPSMWFSETPFLTSIQIQQAFAQRHNVVLLSSGTNSPQNSNTGSGIFIGRFGAIEKIISWKNETRMMIAEIPKNIEELDYEPVETTAEPYSSEEMDELTLWSYKSVNTIPLQEHLVSNYSDNFKCEFLLNFSREIDLNVEDSFDYRLTSFSGIRSFAGVTSAGEIHCAIISCSDEEDEDSCGRHLKGRKIPSVKFHSIEIKLTMNSEEENIYIMPTSLDTSIVPFSTKKYSFETEADNNNFIYTMKSNQQLDNLMTFGLYGRNFNLDSKETIASLVEMTSTEAINADQESLLEENEDDEDKSFKTKMFIYVFLMIVLSILTVIMTYRKLQTPYLKPDYNKRKSCSN